MRRFAWTRILSVLMVLCMLVSLVSMGITTVSAERVELDTDTIVEYFPVTLFDYDEEEMNAATHKVEYEANNAITEWSGLYFSTGDPDESYHPYATGNSTSGKAYQLVDLEFDDDGYVTNLDASKKYIFVNVRGSQAIYDNNSASGTNFKRTGVATAGDDTIAYTSNVTEWTAVEVTASYTSTTATYNELWSSGSGSSSRTWYETDYYYLVNGTYEKVYIYRSSNNNSATYTAAYSTSYTTISQGTRNTSAGTFYILSGDSSTAGFQLISDRSSSTNYYMYIASGVGYSRTTETTTTIKQHSAYTSCVSLSQGSYYMNHYEGTSGTDFAGYTAENTTADAFYIYEVVDSVTVDESISLPYSDWNHWDKSNSASYGNLLGQGVYSGLVASQLDANKNIVFNVPDAGLFTLDEFEGKKVYTNAQIPFLYNAEKNIYEFDSDTHGVYFADSDQAGGTSATPASNSKLYFNKGQMQTYTGMAGSYGDGSSNLWAPFNSTQTIASVKDVNYYFGMNATVPFTMTTDGKMTNGDDDIEFSFSGDDDVWIFIDGVLVADLGGIHNRLNVTINFATNKVTYFVSDSNTANNNGTYYPIVDGNGYSDSNTTGNLFANMTFTASTDEDGTNGAGTYSTALFNETATSEDGTTTTTTGVLNTDRVTFAAKDTHELTIFYMERGAGSSNARIWFNLPVKDTVSVQKIVDEQMVVNEDGSTTRETLSAEYQAVVNNLAFEFAILKNGVPLANTTYNLLNANGQVIANPSTDANGKFTLKNGQTAKFTGEFTSEETGDTYQVYETIKDGFIYTEFSATKSQSTTLVGGDGELVTDTHTYYTKVAGENESSDELYTITDKNYPEGDPGKLYSTAYTVYGTDETEDSLSFVCENLLNASLPTPSAIPNDDKFVLDFGLSAELEIFSNDLYIGENPTISIDTTGLKYGTATYDAATKKVTYTPNKQLTGVEVIPYTLTVSATGADNATGTAYIYIIPATTMYYEEDFSDFVTYTGSDWYTEGTAQTDKQEPGMVGTVGDSPYGSDAAYLNDSADSNGSSKFVDTTNGAKQFSYTFTGTGTSFYARTAADTGYLRIVIKDSTGTAVHTSYRDTRWGGDETTLYNIPVFTWNVEDSDVQYGTYTVQVTIAKAFLTVKNKDTGKMESVQTYGKEFWLDGIRVYNPLMNDATAEAAYAADGEANMTAVTIRDKLILEDSDKPEGWYILYTDSTIGTEDDYIAYGPKEEVYLFGDKDQGIAQSVTFALTNWNASENWVYLGLKAPTGSGKVTIGSTTLEINNTVDCFYDISNMGTIKTDEDGVQTITFTVTATEGLISATTIKVTGAAEFTIIDMGPEVNVDGSEGSGEDNGEEGDIDADVEG